MTLLEQIQQQLKLLPPEKQGEVMDFIAFLQQRLASNKSSRHKPLHTHSAFGSWSGRNIDALKYQESIRAEWESPSTE